MSGNQVARFVQRLAPLPKADLRSKGRQIYDVSEISHPSPDGRSIACRSQ